LDAHDGGDCNQLGLYINWHRGQIDCDQLGSCINQYIVKSIAISLDRVLMDVDGGFDGGSMVGFTVGSKVGLMVDFTWLCWAINLREAFVGFSQWCSFGCTDGGCLSVRSPRACLSLRSLPHHYRLGGV
jgi:hypothetical protein